MSRAVLAPDELKHKLVDDNAYFRALHEPRLPEIGPTC